MQSRPRAPSPRSEGTRERWVRADRSGSRGQTLGEEKEERDWVGSRTRASELVIESRGGHGEMRSAGVRATRRRRRRRHARRDGHGTTTSTKLPGCFEVGPGRTAGGRARISAGPTYRGWKDGPARARSSRGVGSGGRLASHTRKRTRAGPGVLMTCLSWGPSCNVGRVAGPAGEKKDALFLYYIGVTMISRSDGTLMA